MLEIPRLLEEAHARLITRRGHGVEKWQAAPELEPIARGAYLECDPTWKPWEKERMVGLARIQWLTRNEPKAVMALESAALLHGLPVIGKVDRVHSATGSNGNHRSTRLADPRAPEGSRVIVARHAIAIPETDLIELHGIPTVTPQRIMLDFARFRPPRESLPITDAALRALTSATRFRKDLARKRADPILDELAERLEQTKGRRGMNRARAVIHFTNPLSESPGESALRWVILALGLPHPTAQKHVQVQGQNFYVDVWIEELGLGFEFDGLLKYDTETPEGRAAFTKEKRRDDLLASAGVLAHHVMNEDVTSLEAGRLALTRCLGADRLRRYTPRKALLGG
ncbi:MAG: hypothetical protein Q4G64_09105 [bacterium]|nr:hypothetical protein [bacterium]